MEETISRMAGSEIGSAKSVRGTRRDRGGHPARPLVSAPPTYAAGCLAFFDRAMTGRSRGSSNSRRARRPRYRSPSAARRGSRWEATGVADDRIGFDHFGRQPTAGKLGLAAAV